VTFGDIADGDALFDFPHFPLLARLILNNLARSLLMESPPDRQQHNAAAQKQGQGVGQGPDP